MDVMDGCRAQLTADQEKTLAAAIAEADQLFDRTVQLASQPANIGCDRLAPEMAKACGDERWSAYRRACIVAGGKDHCFQLWSDKRWASH
jgi:hypothetical protein